MAKFGHNLSPELLQAQKRILKEKVISGPEAYHQLVDILHYHEHRYYIDNDPQLSDFEYDTLYKILEKAESDHSDWIRSDSPTQRVASDVSNTLETVAHMVPMLSLDNTYNLEDLQDFDQRVKKLCGLSADTTVEYLVEPKFDGGSVSVLYINDQLVRAATRGDGIRGEDITLNARTIRSLPLSAPFKSLGVQQTELRGEALIRKDVFEEVNQSREEDGLSLLANPRNAATGALRVKDPSETASRKLDMFIFQWGYAVDAQGNDQLGRFKKQSSHIEALQSLGFKVAIAEKKVCQGIAEVFDFISGWANKRDHFEYELDGMVIKVNDLSMQEICGFTSHHPRWAVAYKFQAKQATSVLLNVEYQVGKIGAITPVAKIEPVQLAGVTVSSISLHNEDFIRSKDIRLGDTVLVERAGDVIPYIVKSFPETRPANTRPIHFPTHCPSCDHKLVREDDEAVWRCPNAHCPAQIVQKLIHHASKDAMDIDGLGASLVERFYQLGMLKTMADFYRLDFEFIATLEGMGKKSADKLRRSIEKAKANPIHRFLHGLCIHHLGKKISKLIAAHLNDIKDLEHWTLDQYRAIKDVGPVVGQNIMDFFSDADNVRMIHEMEALGVNMKQTPEDRPAEAVTDGPFSGQTILFTGTLQTMGRKEAEMLAEKNGAKNLSAVSSHLNILVVGEDAGSKLTKAQKLGTVRILTEDEFLGEIGRKS